MQRLIEGISGKVLPTELKDLELNGFVRRKLFTGAPVVVEYELTEYAETLVACYKPSPNGARKHKEMVKKSMHMKEEMVA